MEKANSQINCPNCSHAIDVNQVLSAQLEDQLRQQYAAQLARERKLFLEKESVLKRKQEQLLEEREQMDEQIREGVRTRMKAERERLEQQLKTQIREEQSEQVKAYQQQLQEQSEKLKVLHRTSAEVEKLKREKDELQDKIMAEAEQKVNEKLRSEKEKIRKAEEEKILMKMAEKNNVIEQLRKQLVEAQRKAEQGSMQLQGEVQELAIEDWLTKNFPMDTIEEIKKGVTGGDCVQIVNTRNMQNCGLIYYESKRTKAFSPAWIEKFKNDIRDKNASVGVLVTDAMPKDMERMGLVDGVWVCSFEEFKSLCFVLRDSVIRIAMATASQENKGDKMAMLYNYLTSNEFRLQVEGIVDGFTQMQLDLEKEKRAMQKIWKSREKQIEKVLTNTTEMYGSIHGIAGSAIGRIEALELSAPEEDEPRETLF